MPSDLLTTDDIKAYITTGLSDEALGRIIDAEDAYIRRQVGPHDPEPPVTTMPYVDDNPSNRVSLPRRASAVTSVIRKGWYIADYVIPTEAWRLEDDGLAVMIYDYYVSRFYDRIEVIFTPEPENAERTKALIELVRLAVQDSGLKNERDDTYRFEVKDKVMARREILAPLRHTHGGFAVLA